MAVTNVPIPSGSVKLFDAAIKLLKDWGWGPFLDIHKDWQNRSNGHKDPQVQTSIMFHHTGGTATSTDYLLNPGDRANLRLLANIHVDQIDQRIRILAAGPSSHAGNGTKANYDRMRAGNAPAAGDMSPVRPDSTWSANRYSVGVEVDGAGGKSEWNTWTKNAVIAVATAFNIAGKWAADGKMPRIWAHKEHTYRKPGDPYMNMGELRTLVKSLIASGTPVTPAEKTPTPEVPVLGKRVLSKNGIDEGADVRELGALLTAKGYDVGVPLNVFGPMMEAAVKAEQTKLGIEPTGVVDTITAAAFKGESVPQPQPEPEEPEVPDPEPPVDPDPTPTPTPTPEPPKPTGPKLPSGGVIIVAGSANKKGGGQSAKQKRRLDVALKYLTANPTAKIVVTGGVKPGRGSNSEAEEARLYLRSKGVDASRIIKENTSGSTYGNFVNGLPLAKKAGAKSVFVISDFSHMRRCLALAYAGNKRRGTGLAISGADWFKDGTAQDATVSQATQQARVAWSGMTAELVQSLDSRWGVTKRRTIRQGNRGEDVKLVQKTVGVTDDGVFGPDTRKAVKAWQKKRGLEDDGIVGRDTWATIK